YLTTASLPRSTNPYIQYHLAVGIPRADRQPDAHSTRENLLSSGESLSGRTEPENLWHELNRGSPSVGLLAGGIDLLQQPPQLSCEPRGRRFAARGNGVAGEGGFLRIFRPRAQTT